VSEIIQASLSVPSDFAAAVPSGHKIEVFAILEVQNGGPTVSMTLFDLIADSVYDSAKQMISFELPGNAFVETSQGDFVATITLSPTPGVSTSRRLERQLQGSGECKAASLRCPVAGGCSVTSSFNPARMHPTKNRIEPHKGVDYRAPTGTSIIAAAGGKIETTGVFNGWGNTVIIRHTDGSATLYAHLSKIDATVGRDVTVGEQIGLAGDTGGVSTGSHLHFEYIPNGAFTKDKVRIDPEPCVGMVTSGSITAGDNGSVADDSFQLSLTAAATGTKIVVGTTTIGGQNNLSVNNLIPGSYTLELLVVVAPDDIGTWFIQLNDGLKFSDGTTYRTGVTGPGGTATFPIIVPTK